MCWASSLTEYVPYYVVNPRLAPLSLCSLLFLFLFLFLNLSSLSAPAAVVNWHRADATESKYYLPNIHIMLFVFEACKRELVGDNDMKTTDACSPSHDQVIISWLACCSSQDVSYTLSELRAFTPILETENDNR